MAKCTSWTVIDPVVIDANLMDTFIFASSIVMFASI